MSSHRPAATLAPSRQRSRAAGRWAAAVALLLLGAAAPCACGRERAASSPEEAFLKLLDACDSGDGARLFDALDTPTQWAIETAHQAQREMRSLVLAAYPAGERDRVLSRLPAACEEDLERPRRYYRRLDESSSALAELRRRIYLGAGQPVGSVRKREGVAEVWREGGSVFHFFRDEKGRWGLMELREPWQRASERALHELETVRQNASLYQRLAPGAAAGKGPP